MPSSALWSGVIASLTNPTSIAAFASVGMHAVLGVTLPSLPFFATATFNEGEPPAPSGVEMRTISAQQYSSLPLAVRNPGLLRTDPSTVLGALPNPQIGLPGFSTLPQPNFSNNSRQGAAQRSGHNRLSPPVNPSRAVPYGNRNRTKPRGNPANSRPRTEKNIKQPLANPTSLDEAIANSNYQIDQRIQINSQEPFKIQNAPNPAYWLQRREDRAPIAAAPERASDSAASAPARPQANNPFSSIEESRLALRQDTEQTRTEAAENHRRWQASPERANSQHYTLSGTYPVEACPLQASGTATYRLTLQPNGSLTNVELIQNAGRAIFNSRARSKIQSYDFPTVEQATPAVASVTFNYSASGCPELSVPPVQPSATPPTQTRAKPQPQPSPSPTPQVVPGSAATSTEEQSPSPEAEPTIVPRGEVSDLTLPETETPASEVTSESAADEVAPETSDE
ncbi:MAG: hypothetical protein F6J87_16100 [Spirulina sp. SIO3F2]|nr:hypothetical protein [Spirulina sp. SIO3F2]